MHNNLSNLFNLTEIKKFIYKRNNLRDECRIHLLDEKYKEASQVALKLFDVCPSYLFISYFFLLKFDTDKKDYEKLLEVIVDRKVISSDVAFFLAKEGMFPQVVIKFLDNCIVKDYIYQIVKKELIIKGYLPFDENMLDNLDDWDLYEYALKNKIELKIRKTVNYEYYLAHKDAKNLELYKKIKNYKELEYLSKLTKTTEHEDYVTDCILKFINGGFDLEKAKEIYEVFSSPSSKYNCLKGRITKPIKPASDRFNLLKVLLGHLIASKDTKLIVFSLYLTYIHRKSFTNNYEVSLIHLFLCRFFLFYKEIDKLFSEFNIKNNQFYSLFFIWSDLSIALNIEDKIWENEYLKLLQENIKALENSLKNFIEKDKIAHVVSLLKVHRKLKNEIVSKEIRERKIYCEESQTLFSDLLGKDCAYLFRKLTKYDDLPVIKENTLVTLSTALSYEDVSGFLINPLGEIKDLEFIKWFVDNVTGLNKLTMQL